MRAVQLDQYGPPENMRVVDSPIPKPSADEVLIKAHISGINFADTLMRRGVYVNLPASMPFIMGREVAGVVEKVGSQVTTVMPGTRVMAFMHTGGYAEYATAQAQFVLRLPDNVSFEQSMVYHVPMRIAYLIYYFAGQIKPMDTILLHAAAGGIGSLITQIAKRRANNIVIALSSSEEKLAYCLANGADYAINYKTNDYVEEVLRITGGKGVDVSLNSVAGPTLKTDPHVVRPLGRWVLYGQAAGEGVIDPYEVMLLKSITLCVFSTYTVRGKEPYSNALNFLINWLHTEELISVTKTFPLENAAEAHRFIEEQRSVGKIALMV